MYHDSPGLRDAPSWKLRVVDPRTGRWGTRSSYFRVLIVNAERNEDWALKWVHDNKTCC